MRARGGTVSALIIQPRDFSRDQRDRRDLAARPSPGATRRRLELSRAVLPGNGKLFGRGRENFALRRLPLSVRLPAPAVPGAAFRARRAKARGKVRDYRGTVRRPWLGRRVRRTLGLSAAPLAGGEHLPGVSGNAPLPLHREIRRSFVRRSNASTDTLRSLRFGVAERELAAAATSSRGGAGPSDSPRARVSRRNRAGRGRESHNRE